MMSMLTTGVSHLIDKKEHSDIKCDNKAYETQKRVKEKQEEDIMRNFVVNIKNKDGGEEITSDVETMLDYEEEDNKNTYKVFIRTPDNIEIEEVGKTDSNIQIKFSYDEE